VVGKGGKQWVRRIRKGHGRRFVSFTSDFQLVDVEQRNKKN
jgi:hypothetical protein